MEPSRVLINYKPQLYTDLLVRIFQSIESVELYNPTSTALNSHIGKESPYCVDVVIFSLDVDGQPGNRSFPGWFQTVKLLAFSPNGDVGYRRLAGEDDWEAIHPFGMEQLIHEVAGSDFPEEGID
jgi:hypothetical protein